LIKHFDKFATRVGRESVYDIFYQEYLQKNHPQFRGQVFFADYSQLKEQGQHLYALGKRVGVIIDVVGMVFPISIIQMVQKKNLFLINGNISGVLANKLTVAILSTFQDSEYFSPLEQSIIRKYIPWTRKVVDSHVDYKGVSVPMRSFLKQNREKFVLKPAIGLGGEDVFLGNSVTQASWEALVDQALAQPAWLVQEYIEPLPLVFQAGEEGWEFHETVWGLFAFGDEYINGFLRVLPKSRNSGVVNCKQGATLSTIFVVDEQTSAGEGIEDNALEEVTGFDFG